MDTKPSRLWTGSPSIDRVPYLLTGVLLLFVKFTIDWTIASEFFGRSWSLLNYLVWPNDRVLRVLEVGDPEWWFSLTLLLVSLPFICTGILLSLGRLRATGLPLGLILFFFVPLVNLLLFLILVLLPTRAELTAKTLEPRGERGQTPFPQTGTSGAVASDQPSGMVRKRTSRITAARLLPSDFSAHQAGITKNVPLALRRPFEPLRLVHRSIVLESYWRSGMVALAITVPLAVLSVVFGAEVLQSYGFSLFVGAPFAVGMISVLVFGFSRPQPLGACLLVALVVATMAGVAILCVALEGAICLLMAAPIALPLALLGGAVGYTIQSRPWLNDQATTLTVALLLTLPALMAAEAAHEPEPALRAVHTEVIVDAPPAKVWPHVIAFPPLPEPDDWFFQTGIAYPQRAEIHGRGVGAVRHCIFSTGVFIEPIEIWDPPSLLRFRVTGQPEPLHEWSPYPIHPAHLDHYLCSHKGQFLLEALPNGRTRLVGTTWYSNRMWPAAYWTLWSDYIIHRIHGRVLTHIQRLTEGPEAQPVR